MAVGAVIWTIASGWPWIAAALVAGLALGATSSGGVRRRTSQQSTLTATTTNLDTQDFLRAALDGLPDPHLVIEAGGPVEQAAPRIRFANGAAMTVLGVERSGQAVTAALRDPKVLEALEEVLSGAATQAVDYESAGAQTRHWRAFVAGLPTDGVSRAVLRLRDETDSRRMEAMRMDFLANASHELRTPLAALAGFIETLRGPARNDEAARDRFLEIMSAQAERMGRLVADLLSLSRIEMNEYVPPTQEISLAGAVLDVFDATAGLAADRRITLCLEPPRPDSTMVIGDRDQLVQVVQNLMDNAIKYSPDGGEVRVRLDAGLSLDDAAAAREPRFTRLPLVMPDRRGPRTYARVVVHDHGSGLAREHLPRLTERFYRVEGQKSGEHSGTGLGLAIVKHITSRHGGGLIVESRQGEGTLFSLIVPEATNDV